jgi:hypothetical protein
MYLMVLEDGETFTQLDGCKIVEVPDEFERDYLDHMEKVVVLFYTYKDRDVTTWSMLTKPTR